MIVRHRFPNTGLDRTFEQLTSSLFDTPRQIGPVVKGAWQGDEYVLTVDLPGVAADAVTVQVAGQTLTLGATIDTNDWQRTLRIDRRLDPDQVHAHHVDGRLTVRIGTIDEPAARRVVIATTPPPAAIGTTGETVIETTGEPVGETTGERVGDQPTVA
ncbi:MAG TPA: Hsp20/alpha crystallin family protein [Ilumatobacter sp.]|nr:Hsp20/alpha crystallin family protein [Ilumatobacter sp.]